MTTTIQKIAISTIVFALSAGPSFAKKPDSPGNSGKNKAEHSHQHDSTDRDGGAIDRVFFNHDRQALIRQHYSQKRKSGKCPPGLAKKNNGCRPPGQVKKWHRGQPLPADLDYYDLPSALLHELGHTPEGQKIVRVGTDLLLIAIGTRMVIEALEGLDDSF